ncbi:MAG TPA: hypothetical protein DCZ95_13010 [Verrucomicrobia bacterium]|nr:MAG: hypothetical protein A2X46_11650 [Lentisphaerae bacterium GWF2_57_35]HBA85007.1 hypothetical protein [Verrucomicrobiota bacterium]
MKKKKHLTDDSGELRLRAETRLQEQPTSAPAPAEGVETQRLLHELQVHQVELEMQNEELKETRDKLESLLEKYTDLYDFAPVGYLTLDPEGTILESNLAGAALLRLGRAALVNRRFGCFVSEEDRSAFSPFLKRAFESKTREICEITLSVEGRPPIGVRMEASILESGHACRVVLTDITERKQLEVDRLILSKLESTGILAGGIAHDFNNLLTVILLDLELTQALMLSNGEEATRRLEEAKRSVRMAQGLTQQLVTFAKGGEPIRKPTFLPGVIQESVGIALSGSTVRSDFLLPEGLWPAEVDPGQFSQVIRNIALNAREAMPKGGMISVQAANVVSTARKNVPLPPGAYIRVSITDRGEGIPKELLPKIFDPYFSTKQRGTQKGMGLGLAICHSVVQKHGGTIEVESKSGVGTTFHLYFPAVRQMPKKLKVSAPKPLSRYYKILVMDDEEWLRNVVGATLQQMGHEVELTEEGEGAIEAFERAWEIGLPFDIVILDLTIRGGMGGQEAIQSLRRIDSGIKAIVMSGYSNDPVILEHERYGFKGALPKPFDAGKLQAVISRIMEN